jgi:hypothetical protein
VLSQLDRDVVESVLQMSDGFVLDFSDRTFSDFFSEFGIAIDDPRYRTDGGSKARRLRVFLRTADGPLIGRVLETLLERRLVKAPDGIKPQELERYRAIVERLLASDQGTEGSRHGANKITEVTRRTLFEDLSEVAWHGRLQEPEFLERICDRSNPRHRVAIDGAWQHRVRNWDWSDNWVFHDSDLKLLECPDRFLLKFLSEMVHPAVRPEIADARELVSRVNARLTVDGWKLVEGPPVSGKPTFVPRRCASGTVVFPEPQDATDVLSDDYVRELSNKCDTRLASGDVDGAVTVARTLLEAILSELEVRLAGARGDYKGDLPKQFKQIAKLLRMDDQRTDLDDRFKDVIRGLVMVANGLAPLRNKMGDGHARERKPAPHHARVVVNAAKTISAFLVESYYYQRTRNLLQDAAASASGQETA